ncbi:MAG: polyprenyl synthetase family protein, partial [Thermodesulfobacteriota bacterium]
MELKSYLKTQKTNIDGFLRDYLSPLDIPPRLKEAMQYSLGAGGKRLRPVLVLAAHDAVGGKSRAAVAVGAAIEMIHTYSLIHDDLPAMDNDDFRRGKPTCHRVFGEAMAILAGDGLLTQAFEILSDPSHMEEVPAEVCVRVVGEVARGAGSTGMVGGQVLDMISEGSHIDAAALQNMHLRKTGALIRAS